MITDAHTDQRKCDRKPYLPIQSGAVRHDFEWQSFLAQWDIWLDEVERRRIVESFFGPTGGPRAR